MRLEQKTYYEECARPAMLLNTYFVYMYRWDIDLSMFCVNAGDSSTLPVDVEMNNAHVMMGSTVPNYVGFNYFHTM